MRWGSGNRVPLGHPWFGTRVEFSQASYWADVERLAIQLQFACRQFMPFVV